MGMIAIRMAHTHIEAKAVVDNIKHDVGDGAVEAVALGGFAHKEALLSPKKKSRRPINAAVISIMHTTSSLNIFISITPGTLEI